MHRVKLLKTILISALLATAGCTTTPKTDVFSVPDSVEAHAPPVEEFKKLIGDAAKGNNEAEFQLGLYELYTRHDEKEPLFGFVVQLATGMIGQKHIFTELSFFDLHIPIPTTNCHVWF